ncbi:GAF domain-containing protein [Pedobacter sp. HMF7647]|uniref:GAF domain-containing protein n=1 Tax=Hufsiella arboris TaxID=2695275 RepID=A0A7K1Y936_9SPHI|nr:GAF domain-containing protein [Hufsiella arboris]
MMNKTNYDSDFCGRLPLNQTNMIQPYGYLLIVEASEMKIIQVSENVTELFDKPLAEIINSQLGRFIPQVEVLLQKYNEGIRDKVPIAITIAGNEHLALVHSKNDLLLIEVEKNRYSNPRKFIDFYQQLKYIFAKIELGNSVEKVCEIAVTELKNLSGFDRVLMYQFDQDWNGTVVAEKHEEGMHPYLGHKFPASDIPKQARAMYQNNAYRFIPDRDYQPIKLFPIINPHNMSFLDLSDCNMRSVASVHVEYLKNMDVAASLSIRIIKDEKLWGLISCHNKTPKYLNYEICSSFELLSMVISGKIASAINKKKFEFLSSLQQTRERLIDNIYTENDLVKGLLLNEVTVGDLLRADGVCIAFKGKINSIGITPSVQDMENLSYWLQAKNIDKTFSEINLSAIYENAEDYAEVASGVIVLPINADRGDYIIGFRKEVIQDIEWGGNPNQAINFEPDGKNYHPRNSFQVWKETVKQTSLPWSEEELSSAEDFRSFLFEYTTRYLNN